MVGSAVAVIISDTFDVTVAFSLFGVVMSVDSFGCISVSPTPGCVVSSDVLVAFASSGCVTDFVSSAVPISSANSCGDCIGCNMLVSATVSSGAVTPTDATDFDDFFLLDDCCCFTGLSDVPFNWVDAGTEFAESFDFIISMVLVGL